MRQRRNLRAPPQPNPSLAFYLLGRFRSRTKAFLSRKRNLYSLVLLLLLSLVALLAFLACSKAVLHLVLACSLSFSDQKFILFSPVLGLASASLFPFGDIPGLNLLGFGFVPVACILLFPFDRSATSHYKFALERKHLSVDVFFAGLLLLFV